MNFDEWLKQGLDDTPGGEWDEANVDEVVSAARRRRTEVARAGAGAGAGAAASGGSRGRHGRHSRRGSAIFRSAAVAAAALVVATGVIGGIVWKGQHTSANKGHNLPRVTNSTVNRVSNSTSQRTTTTKGQTTAPSTNAVVPSTPPPGSNTTTSLQMYGAGTLTPVQAIAWPGLQNNPVSTSQLPVVQVPFTSAVRISVMQAPQSISSWVPPQLKGKLVAYFVQMDQGMAFYLIAPPGLKGTATLAGDSSYAVYLHSADASIEVDTSGASPFATDGMAAPFFKAAAQASAKNWGTSSVQGPLAPAVISHPNPQTAYFSFRAKNGQDVAGINDYVPFNSLPSVTIVYTADAKDWSYAPYVLESANNLLNNVLAPQIGGTVIQSPVKNVSVGGKTYSLQGIEGKAVQTPAGIAYIMEPQVSRKGNPKYQAWANVPTEPYSIAIQGLTQTSGGSTTTPPSMPDTIPWLRVLNAENEVYYAYPGGLTLINNQWLMYSVAWAAPGLNQPGSNDLHIFNLQTNQDTTVTSYLAGGGNFFDVGTSGDFLAYDKSYYTNNATGGTLVQRVTLVNLSTGTKTKLPSSDVVPDKSALAGSAVKVAGQGITIPLQ